MRASFLPESYLSIYLGSLYLYLSIYLSLKYLEPRGNNRRFFTSVGGKERKKRAPQALAGGRKGTGKG
jgi:hypothetical protein